LTVPEAGAIVRLPRAPASRRAAAIPAQWSFGMSIPYPAGAALTCQEIRELDVLAIEHVGIPGLVLMENAGRQAADLIYDRLANPDAATVLILCGPGNNGGDGFVIARHLFNAGVPVQVVLATPPEKSQGDAGTNLRIIERMDVPIIRADDESTHAGIRQAAIGADVIVDALLGTGSKGAPRKTMATLIEIANASPRARRIAIDIPSGLDGDTGEIHEPCFRADATITMVASKVGFDRMPGAVMVGRIHVVDIGVPRNLIPGRDAGANRG
jgi:hydroxyethylthiazole kinase-like uncharacterized protein yjeF